MSDPGLRCANHPGAAAELECRPCGLLFCKACAHALRDEKTWECARCGALLLPFERTTVRGPESRARQRHEATRPLGERLPRVWRYLRRQSVLMTLLAAALLQWLSSFLGAGLILINAGFTAALFFHIVQTTAAGATELDPPDFLDFWSEIMGPLFRMMVTVIPVLVILHLGGPDGLPADYAEWKEAPVWSKLLELLWFLLWPLLILVAAISRSVLKTLDPRVWKQVLEEMGRDYWIGAGLFYAILLLDAFVWTPLVWAIARPLHIPVVTEIVAYTATLFPLALLANILGEVARPYVVE